MVMYKINVSVQINKIKARLRLLQFRGKNHLEVKIKEMKIISVGIVTIMLMRLVGQSVFVSTKPSTEL
jgi:hypothetical protein